MHPLPPEDAVIKPRYVHIVGTALVETKIWDRFVMERWIRGDLTDMEGVDYPERRLF